MIDIVDNAVQTWLDIKTNAPKWLVLMGLDGCAEFVEWLVRNQSTIISFESGYIIIDEYVPDVRVTLHPCFTKKSAIRDEKLLRDIVDFVLESTNVHRVQIRVSEVAGHSIRNKLRNLGFVKEASLQNYTLDRTVTPTRLISVEIWAILK